MVIRIQYVCSYVSTSIDVKCQHGQAQMFFTGRLFDKMLWTISGFTIYQILFVLTFIDNFVENELLPQLQEL